VNREKPNSIETFRDSLWNLKIILLSTITPSDKKQKIRDAIERNAKILALKKGLDISFNSSIQQLPYRTLGSIDSHQTKIERHINFEVNSRYICARKAILHTIFHEYSYFLMLYSSELDGDLVRLYASDTIPKYRDIPEEDFCDAFSRFIIDGTSGNPDLDIFIEKFIEVTIGKIHQENWMDRIPETEMNY
jgi:hypothetical protein